MVLQSAPKADYAPFIRYQRIDCRRRPGRADTGDGTCLARRRCDRDRDPPCRRAAERQVQPGLGALDGDFSPARLADRMRNTGLPPAYRNDGAMCVSVLGTELSRIKLPSRAGRVRGEKGADGHWPCAEWGHRINQLHLEPCCSAHGLRRSRASVSSTAPSSRNSSKTATSSGKTL